MQRWKRPAVRVAALAAKTFREPSCDLLDFNQVPTRLPQLIIEMLNYGGDLFGGRSVSPPVFVQIALKGRPQRHVHVGQRQHPIVAVVAQAA